MVFSYTSFPRRFELTYVDSNGEKQIPVVLHRAIFGTFDRFTAFIIEETKGVFPLWLAPLQMKVLPVNLEFHEEYAKEVTERLREQGFRIELDNRNEKLSYKMREAQTKKIPLTLILGDQEKENNTVSFRRYGSKDTETVSLDEFISTLKNSIDKKEYNI